MPKKLSFDYVKQVYEDAGCTLLEKGYINSETSMRYICSCGNESTITFHNFAQGHRCRNCGNKKSIAKRCRSLDDAKQIFQHNGCTLLADEYKNNNTNMPYICVCGHKDVIRLSEFIYGIRCRECKRKKLSKLRAFSIKYVKQFFSDNNCTLLEEEYINSNTKMQYICACGEQAEITFYRFKQGQRCVKCRNNQFAENYRHSLEYVQKFFLDHNCKLLTNEYINSHTKMPYMCSCGGKSEITFNNFQHGQRCKRCGIEKLRFAFAYTLEEVKKIFHNGGCQLLSDHYVNSSTILTYVCQCGEESKIKLMEFINGGRCKDCGLEKIRLSKLGANNPNWNDERELVALRNTISDRCSNMLHSCLKSLYIEKTSVAEQSLGFTRAQLLEHITSHPNWGNVKNDDTWHIDHIIPISAFIEHGITDLKIINALDNLQPLSQQDNLSKSNKYNEEDFIQYLETKGIYLLTNI